MQALILEQQDGKTLASVQAVEESRLPEGEVTVDIDWSSLNYKDALAITGKGKIIRNFPMVPGIDFAGRVHTSEDPRFHPGQHVLLTGWGVGENHWGGLATQARVKGDWLVPLPAAFSARQAMAIGTAGYTAMLCVLALEKHGVKPADGEIVVTGFDNRVMPFIRYRTGDIAQWSTGPEHPDLPGFAVLERIEGRDSDFIYGRDGRACLRCDRAIVREPFMNRSSYRCPTCQRRPVGHAR